MSDFKEWRTWTTDMDLTQFDEIKEFYNTIGNNYGVEKWMLSFETQKKNGQYKPHYHHLIKYSYDYQNNHNKLTSKFIKDYNLKTDNTKHGGQRRYANGLKKQIIDDLERTIIYMCKEKNYFHHNMDEYDFKELESRSYIQDPKIDKFKLLKDKIHKLFDEEYPRGNAPNQFSNYGNRCMHEVEGYNHAYAIKRFVFNKLLDEENYELKSFSTIKNIAIGIVFKTRKFDADEKYYIIQEI